MADYRAEGGNFPMIDSIGSLQNYDWQSSYQTQQSSPATTNPAPSDGSQPIQDSIQLSAAGLIALQTPGEIFTQADAGNEQAIAIIEKDETPV